MMNILFLTTRIRSQRYQAVCASYLKTRSVGAIRCDSNRSKIERLIDSGRIAASNTLVHARAAGPRASVAYSLLEQEGFRIRNTRSATDLTSNKFDAQRFAKRHGIPIAATYKVRKSALDDIEDLIQRHGSVVVKPIHSKGQGKYCHRLDMSSMRQKFRFLLRAIPGKYIIVQEHIKYVRLIRTVVIGGKMLVDATTYDTPSPGSWKASVCLNPHIKKYSVTDKRLIEIAERTAEVFGCDISFIDFFEDESGEFILNELNTACSLLRHEEVTGIPIHRYICDHLLSVAAHLGIAG